MKEEATEHNSGYLWQLLQSVSPPSNTKLITMTKKLIFCKEKEILFFVEKQEKTILPINDKPEVESSRTSLASRTSSRTHFEVLGLGLGLEGQVLGLGLGLEASSPRKLACPRLEDSTIF